jgi:hypothetical protein
VGLPPRLFLQFSICVTMFLVWGTEGTHQGERRHLALSSTYPASVMDGDPAARSSADAGKKQRGESGRQRTLDSYMADCPPELAYAKDASA